MEVGIEGLLGSSKKKMWEKHELKDHYDVVVVGGGVHGLAIAYYLARRGITNVAVLDKTYLGGGSSGRNTQIIRANYRTPENVRLYNEALTEYEHLSQQLEYNLMLDQMGHTTLAFTDTMVEVLRLRVETNQALGVDSRLIWPSEIKELYPAINLNGSRYPIVAALHHPRGGTVRHDALVWGFAKAAERLGVEIHTHTEVSSITVEDHAVTGVTAKGKNVKCNYVVNATAGWASTVAKMVNLRLPIVTVPLQALVTEPVKPFMNGVIAGADIDVYVYQSDRGEVITGSELDPYSSYSFKTTFPTLELISSITVELLPCLGNVNILRQWTGICDMTPDFSPIMGEVPGIKGFILDVGWGTYGFKTAPASGIEVAQLIATGKPSSMIAPFSLTRFYENRLVDEKAAGVCLRPGRQYYYLQ